MEARLKTLGELDKARNAATQHYLQLNLQKQGLQTELEEMYKPITRSISSGTTAVTKQLTDNYDKLQAKIEELTERMNTVSTTNTATIRDEILTLQDQQEGIRIILDKMNNSPGFNEMVELLKNHPNVIARLNGRDVRLNQLDNEIYSLIEKLPISQIDALETYFKAYEEDNEKYELAPEPKEEEPTEEEPPREEEPKFSRNYLKRMTNEMVDSLTPDDFNALSHYLTNNPDIEINGTKRPYNMLNKRFPGFIKAVRAAQKRTIEKLKVLETIINYKNSFYAVR